MPRISRNCLIFSRAASRSPANGERSASTSSFANRAAASARVIFAMGTSEWDVVFLFAFFFGGITFELQPVGKSAQLGGRLRSQHGFIIDRLQVGINSLVTIGDNPRAEFRFPL